MPEDERVLPKGFSKFVERQQKCKQDKEQRELKIFKETIGERYDKEKLNRIKPPSFIARDANAEQG